MGNARTLHRRKARQRAKAREAAYRSHRASMTVAEREYVDTRDRMLAGLALPIIENNIRFASFVNREYKAGDTITICLPKRFDKPVGAVLVLAALLVAGCGEQQKCTFGHDDPWVIPAWTEIATLSFDPYIAIPVFHPETRGVRFVCDQYEERR